MNDAHERLISGLSAKVTRFSHEHLRSRLEECWDAVLTGMSTGEREAYMSGNPAARQEWERIQRGEAQQ